MLYRMFSCPVVPYSDAVVCLCRDKVNQLHGWQTQTSVSVTVPSTEEMLQKHRQWLQNYHRDISIIRTKAGAAAAGGAGADGVLQNGRNVNSILSSSNPLLRNDSSAQKTYPFYSLAFSKWLVGWTALRFILAPVVVGSLRLSSVEHG